MTNNNDMVSLIKGAAQEGQFHKMSTEEMEGIYHYGSALIKDRPNDKDLLKAIDQFKAEIKNRLSIKHNSNLTPQETNIVGDSLNWKLIFIFVLRIFVITQLIGVVFGIMFIIVEFIHGAPLVFPHWLLILQGSVAFLALFVIFSHFFRVQSERIALHAFMIAFFSWALPLPLYILWTEKPLSHWFAILLAYLIIISLSAIASRWGKPSSRMSKEPNRMTDG